ncbi:MAG: non-canonical purine NTP pyrophosphatase [Patescibacteria group bacterium]
MLQKVESIKFDNDTNIYFVLGMPISDIGKGTLVAHMLLILPNSDAIKYDGLLNTNANGRHTAIGHDDFGIYEKYNKDKTFREDKYILGGYLFNEFIKEYGEYENLCFRPHFYLYFISKIKEMWVNCGRPKNFIVEIGGTIIDYEVDIYVPPSIYNFKNELKDRCKIILLSEVSYNNEYIKTRNVQRSVEELAKRFIFPDYIFAREPKNMPKLTNKDRLENEKEISQKIQERIGLSINYDKIICIPFYDQEKIHDLGDYYKKRITKLFNENKKNLKLFIGSTNKGKIADYKMYFKDLNIISAYDLGISLDVSESSTSLQKNSAKKALQWAKASGLTTLADDTGFFIPALGGKPGVSIKKWGSELKKELTNQEFIKFLKEKLEAIEDTTCYFETCYTIASPKGKIYSFSLKNFGKIDKSLFDKAYIQGFPLSAVFKAEGRDKTWTEMNEQEKINWEKEMIENIEKALPLFN